MPRKKTPHAATTRYAALKAKWEARIRDPNHVAAGDRLIDKPELSLDAAPFLQTLRALGKLTQDQHFADLHSLIMRSDLIEHATGKWSRYGTTLAHPLVPDTMQMIEDLIASGTSERLAIAEAVAELAIGSREATFESACKSVKRARPCETSNILRTRPPAAHFVDK